LERWSLRNTQPIDHLSYNYLEFAHSPDHGPVVLKIGYPNPEFLTEIKALEVYRGVEVAVGLLDWDIEQGALLLERILPGHNLSSLLDDQEATRIAAKTMLSLRQTPPVGDDFPTMEKWCQGFYRYRDSFRVGDGPLPYPLFDKAFGLVKDLLASAEDQFFLHGDLHHSNLLFREEGSWVAIDPKGVIGEFACEGGSFIFNPVPDLLKQPELLKLLHRRLRILEEITGLDRCRLAGWCFCRTVLSAIWSLEEGENHLTYWVEIAAALNQIVK
jgi:streptomycin 6-kinase